MSQPRLSIVIPAHNEETTVGGTLRLMLADAERGEFEVIVAANGCTDRTVEVARSISPDVRVVEVAEPSKIAALNAGDAAATATPRAYIDADVRVDASTLRALADALADPDTPLVASPRLDLDVRGCTWAARQYFRIWLLNEYNRTGHVGSGVYAVSASGRARWASFPHVIADDRYVQQLFGAHERIVLTGTAFTVPAPRTVAAQIRRAVRIHAGNAELRERHLAGAERGSQVTALAKRALVRPSLWAAFGVYSIAYGLTKLQVARIRRNGDVVGWRRDETRRTG